MKRCPCCRQPLPEAAAPPPAGLTPRMAEALAFIRKRLDADGIAPSYGEIAARLGTVKSGAHRLVTALERRGHLARTPGHARGISLIGRLAARGVGPAPAAGAGALAGGAALIGPPAARPPSPSSGRAAPAAGAR